MPKTNAPRIAVLGAGPIGLEAALYARQLQLPVTVFERGRPAEYVRRWGHVRLFSPFGMNATTLGRSAITADSPKHAFPPDNTCITGHEHVAQYLDPLAKSARLRDCLRTETQVLFISRHGLWKGDLAGDSQRAQTPFRLLIRKGKERETVEEADIVLDCTGTYGQHRWLGNGGIPAPGEVGAGSQIAYGLDDILGERHANYAGKTVMVVGGGYSAATTVSRLATLSENHPETWTIWLARGSSTQPIRRLANDPLRERDRLAVAANTLATRGDGNVEFHNRTVIEAIECAGADKPIRVSARVNGQARTWDVERLIANVGYTPDGSLYRELQIHECYTSLGPMALAAALSKHAGADCLQIPSQGPATLANPEPNFFIVGAKSYGRNSHFLMRIGFEQVRDVFALIARQPDLDLYRKP
jgi:hypothetical protein